MNPEDRIAKTVLPSGRVVSTVKLPGELYAMMGGNYETMVFESENDFMDLRTERYLTKEAAEQGHQAIVDEMLQEPREKAILSIEAWK